jgi:hypothetical protein
LKNRNISLELLAAIQCRKGPTLFLGKKLVFYIKSKIPLKTEICFYKKLYRMKVSIKNQDKYLKI